MEKIKRTVVCLLCVFGMEYDVVENPKRWLKKERMEWNGMKQEKKTIISSRIGNNNNSNYNNNNNNENGQEKHTHTQ